MSWYYLEGTILFEPTCIFCMPNREILAEGRLSLAFFDSFPVSKGHALVVPKRHVVTIWDMNQDE